MISNIIIEIKKDKENYTMLESKFFCKSQNYPGRRECRNRDDTDFKWVLYVLSYYCNYNNYNEKENQSSTEFYRNERKKKVKQVMKLDANKVLKKN